MTYILPQPLIFQDFELTVAPVQRRLNAFLFGPHAQILSYDDAEDKAQVGLGTYDHLGQNVDGDFKTCYSWPAKPPGANIDPKFVRLLIDDAMLRIFTDTSLTMTKVNANRIKHPDLKFADNGEGHERSDEFLRDIQPGDSVTVRSTAGGAEYLLYTYVRDVAGDIEPAVVGPDPTDVELGNANAV